MKISVIVTLVIALLLMATFYTTRPWDGDAWVAKQLAVTKDVITCTAMAKDNYPEFTRTCDPQNLAKRSKELTIEILDVINTYPSDYSTEQFLTEHFTDPQAGYIAMSTNDIVLKGLALMEAYMERDNAIKKGIIEIEKAKKEAAGIKI
jgi:hypothetical protein